jgi:hypothetical protein
LLDGPVHRLLQPLYFLLEKPNERTVSSCSRKSGKIPTLEYILFSNSLEKIVFLRPGEGDGGHGRQLESIFSSPVLRDSQKANRKFSVLLQVYKDILQVQYTVCRLYTKRGKELAQATGTQPIQIRYNALNSTRRNQTE